MTRSSWPVLIGSRRYVIEPSLVQRQTIPRVRETVNVGGNPGVQALAQEHLWRRTVIDWRLGAGQEFLDLEESQDARSFVLAGFRYRSPGEIIFSETHSHQETLAADASLIGGYGPTLNFTKKMFGYNCSDGSGQGTYFLFHDITGTPANEVSTMARLVDLQGTPTLNTLDGTSGDAGFVVIYATAAHDGDVWWQHSADGLVGKNAGIVGGTGAWQELWGTEDYLFGRQPLASSNPLVRVNSATGNAVVGQSFDLPYAASSSSVVTSVIQTPVGIYVSGFNLQKRSWIAVLTSDPETGDLTGFSDITDLPVGEEPRDMVYYAGFILIATTKGVRMAQIQSDRTLLYGPLVGPEVEVVQLAAGRGGVYGACRSGSKIEPDGPLVVGTDGPIVVLYSPENTVEPLAPAWSVVYYDDNTSLGDAIGIAYHPSNAPLTATEQQDFITVGFERLDPTTDWNGVIRAFPIRTPGNIYGDSGQKAIYDTGIIDFGLPGDDKAWLGFHMHHRPLSDDDTAITAKAYFGETEVDLGAPDSQTGTNIVISEWTFTNIPLASSMRVRFTINTASSVTEAFAITQVEFKATLATESQTRIILPVIIHEQVEYQGKKFALDVASELAYLFSLEEIGVIDYEIGTLGGIAKVDNVTIQSDPEARLSDHSQDLETIVYVELVTL